MIKKFTQYLLQGYHSKPVQLLNLIKVQILSGFIS